MLVEPMKLLVSVLVALMATRRSVMFTVATLTLSNPTGEAETASSRSYVYTSSWYR